MQNDNYAYLEKLHALELKIAVEIKRICEKHQIPYFLTAGTLLGAVRHGGFIPWDDDMDIGMLRKDYERFVKVCDYELGEAFYIRNWENDPEYPFSYGKVCLKNTNIVEAFSEGSKSKMNGIFVDIFPFDNVPDDPVQQKKQARKYFFFKRALWIKKGMGADMKRGSISKRVKYFVFNFITLFLRYDYLKKQFQKTQIKFNEDDTNMIVTDGAYGYSKESIKRAWATELAPIQFENEVFLSYRASREYLEYFYGDFMKLPPEDKRHGHSIKSICFGPYA